MKIDKTKQKYIIVATCLLTILLVSSTLPFSSVSGYQSMTANWYKVHWPDAQDTTTLYEKDLRLDTPNPTTFIFDADQTGPEVPDGMSNLNTYSGEIENLKFDRNINYHDWWVNDTVSATNPTGEAKHYEWAIDIYTMNVNFYATAGTQFAEGLEIWAEIENNYESVFNILGAEAAVSYVLYAETASYEFAPADAGWHLILPAVGDFEMMFMSGTTAVPPGVPQDGSDLDFSVLEKYSHVAIPFKFVKFGTALWGSDCTVNMVVNLNVLTIGRFDYALTYVEGGDNDVGPIGELGLFAGIGAALGAGFNALMDGFVGLGEGLFGPIVAVVVIGGCIVVLVLVLKKGRDK